MKLIVNVEALTPPMTGIGHYTQSLLRELISHTEIEQLACFYQSKFIDLALVQQYLQEAPQASHFSTRLRFFLRRIPGAYRLRSAVRNRFFSLATRTQYHGAIYHEPNYILKPYAGPAVTTIHDLTFFRYPDYHPIERIRYLERELPRTIERADHIITDTGFVKRELVETLGVSAERITAIPLGVSKEFRPRSEEEIAAVLNRHGLNYQRYLLTVGTLEPRKNLSGLLRAYMRLPVLLRRRYPLVMAGGRGWRSDELEKKITALEIAGEIKHLGYLSSSDLVRIYSGSAAFAFPSHDEGFGLPPLEAMASGVPVLSSNNSAMAEVIGDSGILVNSNDDDEIFSGLQQMLTDIAFRDTIRYAGLEQAAKFTWRACAEQTIAVYNSVLG